MKLNRITSSILTCAVIGAVLPAADVYADDTNWQDIYQNLLREYMNSEDYKEDASFDLYDIGGYSVPELIISEGTAHADQCIVYTVCGGEPVEVDKLGSCGTIGYCPEKDAVLAYNCGQGYESGTYYNLENRTKFNRIFSYSNDAGAAESKPAYQLNGKTVSYEAYSIALSNYKSENFKWLGTANPLTEEGISAFFDPAANWRELYKTKLSEYRDSECFSEESMFDLYDLDGNGVPELMISENAQAPLSIYTVLDRGLLSLGTIGSTDAFENFYAFYPGENVLSVKSYFTEEYSADSTIFFRMENYSLKATDILAEQRDSTFNEYIYTINGEKVTFTEYSDAAYGSPYIYTGRKYSFGDRIIDYALASQNELTDEQKKLYLRKLCELKSESTQYLTDPIESPRFELCDLDGDASPELIVSAYASGLGTQCSVFTIHDGKLSDYGSFGVYGEFRYNAESGSVYTLIQRMGSHHGSFYKLSGGECTTEIIYSDNEEYVSGINEYNEENGIQEHETAQYIINGSDVSKEEYYAAIAEYENEENYMQCGRRCIPDGKGIVSALYGSDSVYSELLTVSLDMRFAPLRVQQLLPHEEN
ncbi:MAG: hypothetical protein IJX77_05545 [Ruminococcus sp.]|nr:hypothetical protein [Ruminococcus sp.]